MKTGTGHTPGPWKIVGYDRPYIDRLGEHSPILAATLVDSHGTVIAHINIHEPDAATRDKCHANARLIEVAPDLLKALRDLVETCERIGPPPIRQGTLCEENDWHYDMRKAKAAISKAEAQP